MAQQTFELVFPRGENVEQGQAASVRGDAPGASDLGRFATVVEVRPDDEVVRLTDARAASPDAPARIEGVSPDTVFEVELADGAVWWTNGAELAAEFGQSPKGEVEIKAERSVSRGGGSRGLGSTLGSLIRTVRRVRVTTPAEALGGAAGERAAVKIARALEDRREHEPGLYRVRRPGKLGTRIDDPASLGGGGGGGGDSGDDPWLILLHGTFSSTAGSFGDLDQTVLGRYGARALAFEHRSVTESPVANALELVRLLPKGARLHLVSHSRGGLIGELLVRGELVGAPFIDGEIEAFGDDAHAGDQDALTELGRLLVERKLVVERFVRVAAPVRGTLLASDRLDRYLSLALQALGLVLPKTSESFRFLKALTVALVRERADATTLPGLEAMRPTSPLVALLNRGRGPARSDLTVIAGDIEPGWNLFGTLSALATDLFYRQAHDLVVDSWSMFGGAERAPGQARYWFEKSSRTTHFAYFRNASTADRLRDALATRPGDEVPGFQTLAGTEAPAGVRGIAGEGIVEPNRLETLRTDRPVVVLLPGIMGSRLRSGDNIVWLDIDDLVGDGFLRLELREGDRVTPAGPIEKTYRKLAHHLAKTHEVVPFSFDWRRDIDDEADRLGRMLGRIADRTQQPIRLLAHSMGGLVTRRARALHGKVWQRLAERPDFRFVMLGTPNGGSHAITSIFFGEEKIFRLLLVIAPDAAARRVVSRFPGLVGMLPATLTPDGDDTLHDHALWERWEGDGIFAPDADTLAAARRLRQDLNAEDPLTEPGVLYVAGQADETPVGIWEDDDGPHLAPTGLGDGRVPWATGIPTELRQGDRLWYAPGVGHGDLASERRLFAGLVDLLARGETSSPAFSRQQPIPESFGGARSAIDQAAREGLPRRPELALFPTADELVAAAVGAEPPSPVPEPQQQELAVTLAHGSLTFAHGPVLVGHYERDVIASAERILDRTLDGALSHRHALGLYPGPVGTSEVVLDTFDPQRGALVLGLGPVGEISPGTVSRGVRQAVLRYAMKVTEVEGWEHHDPTGRPLLSVASLLIGSGNGTGMSVEDSLLAVIQGVTDAVAILGQNQSPAPTVGSLQFVELYEHRAICASEALQRLRLGARLDNPRVAVRVEPRLGRIEGGQRDIPCGDVGWYRRLQIVEAERYAAGADPGCPNFRDLMFTTLTDRARAEVRLQATQRQLVESLVRRSVRDTAWRPELSHTLFELLYPRQLKDYAPHELDLVLVLDRAAAGYPWELMTENLADREPMAVRSGVLRQLATRDFRERPMTPVANNALVVGDPESDDPRFPPLPGALAEAKSVAARLRSADFDVRPLLQSAPEEVVLALYERPHKVLHIAAHGTYDPNCPEASGVVLADGMRLTATEIEQLRQVPELVFVNCCHLGIRPETGDIGDIGEEPADLRPDTRHLHQLAASLGVALIEMGVKAVVVAGWAVDDAAATTFADAFYRSLLAGDPFGAAVKGARRECYRRHPTHNTWGAYQCYGDPAYRLRTDDRTNGDVRPPDWTTPVQAVQQLDNLRSRARTGSSGAELEKEIEAIEDKIAQDHPDWLWNGRVREALGRAWAELADLTSWTDPSTPGPDPTTPFAKALEHLDAALGCDDSPGTLQLRGDLANIQVRAETVAWRTAWRALDRRRAQLAVDIAEIAETAAMAEVEDRSATLQSDTARDLTALLAELERDLERWPTPRRWTRVGSAAKRLAAVFPGAGRTYLVQEAIDAYEEANGLARERCGEDDPYPAFNWILLRTLAHLADGRRGLDGVEPVLVRLEAAGDDSTYWERLLPVQTSLARRLGEIYQLHEDSGLRGAKLRQAVTPAARAIAREAEGASRAMRSHYQLALYLESLDTLIDLTDDRWQTSRAGADRLAAARHLIQHLRAEIARQAEAIRDR